MIRDYQRKTVYGSEQMLHAIYDNAVASGSPVVSFGGVTLTLPPEARFGSIGSVQAYVDRVTAMPSVLAAFGDHGTVAVRGRKGQHMAHYDPRRGEIALHNGTNRWQMRELIVLHELAHHLALASSRHGHRFTATLIELVGLVMGPEAGLLLRMIFAEDGVHITDHCATREG